MTGAAGLVPGPRVIVLDTQALHYARLFLDLASEEACWPYAPEGEERLEVPCFPVACWPFPPGPEAAVESVKEASKPRTHLRDALASGLRLVFYLMEQCGTNAPEGAAAPCEALVLYPPIVMVELLCGWLRGRAILNAAEQKLPDRMWTRLGDREFFSRLDAQAYDKAASSLTLLVDRFADIGITIQETSPRDARDVWGLAREVLRHVFLDSADVVVYATALLEVAEEVVTFDGHLERVINGVRTGTEPEQFARARKHLVGVLKDYGGMKASEVVLPQAISPPTLPGLP